jgi:hypothetical protein
MTKRPTLIAAASAAKKRVEAQAAAPTPAPPVAAPEPRRTDAAGRKARPNELTRSSETTAVHLPREDLALLRRVAVERAIREGGRPSVSDVLRGLIEKHRAELEAEATR